MARGYVAMVVTAACVTAVCAVLFRGNRPLVSFEYGRFKTTSFLWQSRVRQTTSNRCWLRDDLERYEKMVPAEATVGVRFPEDMYEYPLFGKGLTRTVIPLPHEVDENDRLDYVVFCAGRQAGIDYVDGAHVDRAEKWEVREVRNNETVEEVIEACTAAR